MRKSHILIVPCLALLLAACPGGSTELPPPVDVGGSPPSVAPVSPVSPASPIPEVPEGATVINGCVMVPEAECPDAELARSSIAGLNLKDSNFTNANLSGSDLRQVDFRNATLAGTNLRNSDLSGADLSGADLLGASMKFTNVTNANLDGANMKPNQLSGLQMCKTIRPDGRRDDSDCPENPGTGDVAGSGPTIKSFTLPATVVCSGTQTTIGITAKWETKQAKTVTFEQSGKAFDGDQKFSKSGEDTFEYPCKKEKVTYTLVATDAEGLKTQRNAKVTRAA